MARWDGETMKMAAGGSLMCHLVCHYSGNLSSRQFSGSLFRHLLHDPLRRFGICGQELVNPHILLAIENKTSIDRPGFFFQVSLCRINQYPGISCAQVVKILCS